MNKSEQLIACLEGEIAKRDARIAEMQERFDSSAHRTSLIGRLEIENDQLRAELAALKEQEPIGWYTEDHLDDKSATTYSWTVAERWVEKGWPVSPLYAAPVSEAKAQGVVQWPEADEIMQMAFEEGQPADDASGYCFELEEFDLFIERLMSDVARLNAVPVQQVSVPDDFVCDSKPLQELLNATAMLLETPCPDSATYWAAQLANVEQLLAAPAAPAADAGLVAVEWAKDAEEWGPALNEAGWLFLSELNEDPQKSALIFNNCKGPLRAAIMKYAEIVTAHRAQGVV